MTFVDFLGGSAYELREDLGEMLPPGDVGMIDRGEEVLIGGSAEGFECILWSDD